MIQDIKIRYVADTTQIENKIKTLKQSLAGISNTVNKNKKDVDDLGKGFYNAIPIALIEQAIQRTGEWAQTLQRAAEQTRTTTDQYQILQELFKRSHLDEGNIKSFFDKLNSSATEAVSGNGDLISSFARLGVQMKDLQTMPTVNLFEKILGKGGDLSKSNIFLGKVFGKESIQDIQNLGMQFTGGGARSGGSLGEYGDVSGIPTVSNKDISSISDSWTSFLMSMKGIGVALAPIGVILLDIVTGIGNMLSGVVTTITGIMGDIMGATSWAGLKKLAGKLMGRGASMAYGATESVTSMVGMTKTTDEIRKSREENAKYWGLNMKESKAAAGAGEAVLTAATFGVGTGVKVAGYGLKGASLGGRIGGLSRMGEGLAARGESKGLLGELLNGGRTGDITSLKSYGKTGQIIKNSVLGGGQLALAAGAGLATKEGSGIYHNPPPGEQKRGAGVFGYGIMGTIAGAGASNANLHFGGVYGQDIQTRLMKLNEKMVDYLFQIVQNTGGRVGAVAPSAYRQYPSEMH